MKEIQFGPQKTALSQGRVDLFASSKSEQKEEEAKIAAENSDASVVNLPPTRVSSYGEKAIENTLSSLLTGIKEDKKAAIAHGNLDPSRVMDLLKGLED